MRSAPYQHAAAQKAPQGLDFLAALLGDVSNEDGKLITMKTNENAVDKSTGGYINKSNQSNITDLEKEKDPLHLLAHLNGIELDAVFREYNWGRSGEHLLPQEGLLVLRQDLAELARSRGLGRYSLDQGVRVSSENEDLSAKSKSTREDVSYGEFVRQVSEAVASLPGHRSLL